MDVREVKATNRVRPSLRFGVASAISGHSRRCAAFPQRVSARDRAFTLTDILVSLSVIAVLISLLLPSLSMVRESTRRLICSSNIRQVGLGLMMFADDHEGKMPGTGFVPEKGVAVRSGSSQAQNTMIARVADFDVHWDGLGYLYQHEYIDAPGVFYCPSHHGEHAFKRYAGEWAEGDTSIMTNYQYRPPGLTPELQRFALVTDGLRTQGDYNHGVGSSILRSDFSVTWFSDQGGALGRGLPLNDQDLSAASKVESAWLILDR